MIKVLHPFEPVYDNRSKVLVLGTIPSPKSREYGFYYGHPQNRFWPVMAEIFRTPVPVSVDEKRRLMLENGVALWDVLRSCEITGASDSSIKSPVCNDFAEILSNSRINAVFTTGTKATSLYSKLCFEKTRIPAVYLPSSSPANRRISFENLVREYKMILDEVKGG